MVDDVFVLLSAWWVKSIPFLAAALVLDVAARSLPWRTALVGVAFTLASWLTSGAKEVVERERPTGATLVDTPESYAFPSGHASTAFAAAVALALIRPRTAWWALPLAALVAVSRVYLEVHWWTDVVAGAVLGTVVAVVLVRTAGVRFAHAGFGGSAAGPRGADGDGRRGRAAAPGR